MKLGISYNFFNGEEHLIPSIKSVRPAAHHVQVVFQKTSNAGHPASMAATARLQEAVEMGQGVSG